MISIPAILAIACGNVFRRLLAPARLSARTFVLVSSKEGIRLRCITDKVIVEALHPEPGDDLQAVLPLELLTSIDGRRSDGLTLAMKGSKIEARWTSGGVPQTRLIPHEPPKTQDLPAWPKTHESNSAELLAALDNASQVVAKDNVKFATDRLALCGSSGNVIGTDGRQLLVLGKFEFPWKGQKLVPAAGIFGLKEFADFNKVRVADAESHVMLKAETWTFMLPVHDGRYPDFQSVIPKTTGEETTWRVSPSIKSALVAAIDKLPGGKSDYRPITIDLGKTIALRAVDEDSSVPTELVVPGFVKAKPVRLATDRRYLVRALELGFDTFVFADADRPIVCRKEKNTFVWVPLHSKTAAIPPHPQAVRIDLAASPSKPLKATTVAKATPKTNPSDSRPQAPLPAPAAPQKSWRDLLPAWNRVKTLIRNRLHRQPEWN